MPNQHIEIVIKGAQGSGKTTVFDIVREALEKSGYNIIPLLPIASLGMEERAMAHKGDLTIQFFTQQEEVGNG